MKNNFLISCLTLNALIWLTGILYLNLKSPTYTSEWIVNLPGKGKSTSVTLPEIGVADSRSDSPYNFYADPRENYSALAKDKLVLQEASNIVGIDVKEFGKPKVKIVDNSTMMEFSIEGETAEIAQEKAIALNSSIQNKLNQLRKEEIKQINQSLEIVLENSQQNLDRAKKRFFDYKAETPLNRQQQLNDMSVNIEDLRKSRAQTLAEVKQINAFIAGLSTDIGLSPKEVADAITLQSNSVFREYLAQYSKASADLINVSARLLPSHPEYINRKEDKEIKETALITQSQAILGRTLSNETLSTIQSFTISIDSQQDNVFNQLVSAQARKKGLESSAEELTEQILKLEGKLKVLNQQESTFETLKKELQVAETIFSTNLTNLNLENSDIFASYPSLQILTQPDLPGSPSSPNKSLTIAGMIAGSFLVTTGLLYSKYIKKRSSYLDRETEFKNFLSLQEKYQNSASSLNPEESSVAYSNKLNPSRDNQDDDIN